MITQSKPQMVGAMVDIRKNQALRSAFDNGAEFFRRRWLMEPVLCVVHPTWLEATQDSIKDLDIQVKAASYVLPQSLWIGYEE